MQQVMRGHVIFDIGLCFAFALNQRESILLVKSLTPACAACNMAMKSINFALCSTSDVITFDQSWHHLHAYVYSSFAEGTDLSSVTQIGEICSMEHEICTKMLRNVSENVEQNFL